MKKKKEFCSATGNLKHIEETNTEHRILKVNWATEGNMITRIQQGSLRIKKKTILAAPISFFI
jgi:hypothetical protein